MKTCRTCDTAKAEGDFYKQPRNRDGLFSECKECIKAYEKDKSRVFRASPEGKAYQRRLKKENTERLTDAYVKHALVARSGLSTTMVPSHLVEAKRAQLAMLRLMKKLKQEIANQLENDNGN